MSRIGYIADPHIANHQAHGGAAIAGINRRCQLCFFALGEVMRQAGELRLDELVVLGDVYDNTRPLPQVEAEVAKTFAIGVRATRIDELRRVTILMGNHDRNSSMGGDHALGPLDQRDGITVATGDYIMRNRAYLPFRPEPVTSWFEAAVEKLHNQSRIVTIAAHFGLHDAAMREKNKWMADSPDAAPVEWVGEVMAKYGVERLFCGNWHEYRQWPGSGIVQVGSLCPTGWDNPGLEGYGSLVIENTMEPAHARIERFEIPGPRFVTVRSHAELVALAPKFGENRVFVRWLAKPDAVANAVAWLKEMSLGLRLEAWEVVPDDDHVKEAAHVAAASARRLDTLGAVAAEYVGGLVLPAPVRREEVLRRMRGYLGI